MTEIEKLTDEMKELAERVAEVEAMIEQCGKVVYGYERSTLTEAINVNEIKLYLAVWEYIEKLEAIADRYNCEIELRTERIRELELEEIRNSNGGNT